MNRDSILRSLRNLVIDMDGVLYRGDEAIAGTRELIDFLRQQGIGFVLATNNATRTPQQFVDKLAGMAVQVHSQEVLTSSLATASYLARIAPPGTEVFVVGMDGLRTARLPSLRFTDEPTREAPDGGLSASCPSSW